MRFTVQRYEVVPRNDLPVDRRPSLSSSTEKDEDSLDTGSPVPPTPFTETPPDPGVEFPLVPDVITNSSYPSTILEDEAGKIAQIGPAYHDRKTQRLVLKDGSCNVASENITKRRRKYLVDIFTTLVDMKWRYNLLLFATAFVFSWIGFAVLWFVIAVAHGDHLHANDTDWQPCVSNLYDFTTAMLFSIETQHTIGYGYRVIEPTCPGTMVILMIQSCFGVFIQSLVTGLIFAKLSRPKGRSHTIMFSRCAVVSKQNGEYCLLFRVGDMRKSHFVGTSIRALLVTDKNTEEGETIPLCQTPLDLETDSCSGDNFVFLVWPVTVVHKIGRKSPLWMVAADTLLREQFEIIVILEGIVESTGGTTQVRTSYLPSEILWGYRLAPLMTYQKENGQYKIDYTQFHQVLPLHSMPPWSAQQNHERRGGGSTTATGSRIRDPDSESTSVYFTTAVRANAVRHSVIKRMRTSLRKRTTSQRESAKGTGSASGPGKADTGNGIMANGSAGHLIRTKKPGCELRNGSGTMIEAGPMNSVSSLSL